MGFDKLDVVRKLLAKAERAATPEEADSYTDKALQLSARHGLDAALAAGADPDRDELTGRRITVHDPYSAGKARLLAWTASALRCRAVLHERPGGRVGAVTVFGFASDRTRVEVLYTSLLLQATGQLTRQRPDTPGESVAAYRRSWLHGFAVRMHQRLQQAEQAAADDRADDGTAGGPADPAAGGAPRARRSLALVLADRTERVEQAFAEAFPALGRARRRALSGSGFADGADAADRADLGGVGVHGDGRSAIGV